LHLLWELKGVGIWGHASHRDLALIDLLAGIVDSRLHWLLLRYHPHVHILLVGSSDLLLLLLEQLNLLLQSKLFHCGRSCQQGC
jgi:hypothetical protein